jgi:hypothetical protein
MIKDFEPIARKIKLMLEEWESKLATLPLHAITERRNNQNRTIKQIVGHLIDSATNNTHRVIHLQYQSSPLQYPNYASHGNNDRWIGIQNYQYEDWNNMIQLLKYSNLHYAYIIGFITPDKLQNTWDAGDGKFVSLKDMVIDYLRHFKLHLDEIDVLINYDIAR